MHAHSHRRFTRLAVFATLGIASLVAGACKTLDVENLNGVSSEGLRTDPTVSGVLAVAQGLQRAWRSTSGGQANTLAKHGFETWQLRASEPRTLTTGTPMRANACRTRA